MSHAPHPSTDSTAPVEVIRSEERLVAGVEREIVGSVRIGKRIVTEERTVTVTVRREELFVEELAASAATAGRGIDAATGQRGTGPVVTMTLSEEVPEVVVRVVPREQVRVYVDQVTSGQKVRADVAREVVEVDGVVVDD